MRSLITKAVLSRPRYYRRHSVTIHKARPEFASECRVSPYSLFHTEISLHQQVDAGVCLRVNTEVSPFNYKILIIDVDDNLT